MNIEDLKAVARRLLDSRTTLVGSLPFFSRLMLHLKIGIADCETAYTDMENIVFDPAFASRLSDEELQFVFLHEVLHCVLNHCIRGKGLNNTVYNIACDIVVNSMALDILGFTSFTLAGTQVIHLTVNGDEGRKYTAEDIYEMLFNATSTELENFCKINSIDLPSDDSADPSPSKSKTSGNNCISDKILDYTGVDSHDEWKDIENVVLLKDIWNRAVKEASKACGHGSGIPKRIKRYFENIVESSEVNWRQVLQDLIKHNKSDYTYSIPDRRFSGDIIMPSFQENMYGTSLSNIWFLIDTSGSISNNAISSVYGEISSCISQMDNLSGILSFFDTVVTAPVEFTDKDELLAIKPEGGGGTSFTAIFRYLKANFKPDELPEAIIILTDGYAHFPKETEAMNIPVIWIISESDITAPWGKTVSIS